MMILQKYILKKFFHILLFSLLGVLLFFILAHLVENIDHFIDRKVPLTVVLLYYVYFTPYNLILVLPVATLLSTFFSLGSLAKNNEIVAMKALGYSLYQVVTTLVITGVFISIFSFALSEGIVVLANQKKEAIEQVYLEKQSKKRSKQLTDLIIQEPPDKIVTIGLYNTETEEAKKVKVETFHENRLVSRLDAPDMIWNQEENAWEIKSGLERIFSDEQETMAAVDSSRFYKFLFSPKDIVLTQETPDEMAVRELIRFINQVRSSGGEVSRWLTDLYIRFSFPLSNVIIVLFSIPLAYNQRKNMTMGFFISLGICFVYFGLVKMGQTMGEKGNMNPVVAAWLGNSVLLVGSVINLVKARK